jgi:hypothetical protein
MATAAPTGPTFTFTPGDGRTGYEAYAASTGGKTFDGRDMPLWEQLPERIRAAWDAVARSYIEPAPLLPDTAEGIVLLRDALVARCPGAQAGSFHVEGWRPLREVAPVGNVRTRAHGGRVVFTVKLRHADGLDVIGKGATPAIAFDDLAARWPLDGRGAVSGHGTVTPV